MSDLNINKNGHRYQSSEINRFFGMCTSSDAQKTLCIISLALSTLYLSLLDSCGETQNFV